MTRAPSSMCSHLILVDHYNQARYYCSVNHLDVKRQFVVIVGYEDSWNRLMSVVRYKDPRGLAFVNLSEKPLPKELALRLQVKGYPVESAEDS